MTAAGRVLIVPAAGLGTRLAAGIPKLLVPVNGRPMIDHVLDLHGPFVDRIIVVVHPLFVDVVTGHVRNTGGAIELAIQPAPTGMLDAVLIAHQAVHESPASHIWITWCDQAAISRETVSRLAAASTSNRDALVVMPTVRRHDPYIHLERGEGGRIVRILHRREGDAMPEVGESDMGLFSLSRAAYVEQLPVFAGQALSGAATGERNFLPFIAWAAARGDVLTFPVHDEREGIGINTAAELASIESYLALRDAPRPR